MASTPLLPAPLPSISLGDKIHKTERTDTVHAGIMWQRAAKRFLSTASAGVAVAAFSYNCLSQSALELERARNQTHLNFQTCVCVPCCWHGCLYFIKIVQISVAQPVINNDKAHR